MSTPAHQEQIRQRREALQKICGEIFGRRTDFVWEIGCGHGHFLTAFAAAHPESLCVGIDIASDRIERAVRKRDRAEIANLHFVRADARDFLTAIPAGARFASLYIIFPDPWPKRRHHKHRLVTPEFLSEIAGSAGEGARLCIRTDYEPYFSEASAAVRSAPDWRLAEEPWPFEAQTVFQARATRHFSLIAIRKGQK